jgi:hypothetical protein
MRLIFVAAAVKVAAGLAVSPWISGALPLAARALPSWYYVALLVIFGVSGTLLYAGGRNDIRARLLGVVLLLFATLFTDRLAERAIPSVPERIGAGLFFLTSLHFNAFSPLVFWQFAWRFPRVQSALVGAWVPSFMTRLAILAAGVLFAGNFIAQTFGAPGSALRELGTWVAPNTDNGVFWQVVVILELPSLALLVAKFRAANADERRRLSWVVAGIVAGTLPMVIHVLLATTVPQYAAFVSEPLRTRTFGILLTAFSLLIPAATAYAVLVDQVLEVRFVIRQAVQYALARYTVLCLMAALLAGLFWMGYRNRTRTLGELLGDSPWPAAFVLLAAAVLLWRRPLLEAIDRRFFREHYDARRILVELVDSSQKAHSAREIITLITTEIDRALHLERISLLIRDDEGSDQLRDPEGRVQGLDAAGALGSLIAGSHTPLVVDLSSDGSPLGRLPHLERQWLADASVRLLVPLFGAGGRPLGVLALGDKRSGLPFTDDDRKLMAAVAASAALSLEQKLQSESPDPDRMPAARSHPARQCVVCGRVQDRQRPSCHACGGFLRDALLPEILAGKFEIERQIGAGGMGVVYRARDLALNRAVAMKVLPRVLPRSAARLRREARAMATMQHPNLAVIHAMESWHGAPVLVLEYLAGGTLADRIRYGPLPIGETIATGVLIADVLHHVHRAGYLHRDVKPSNIGYTDRGVTKLLDFGLVRFVAHLPDASTATRTTRTAGHLAESDWLPSGAGHPSFGSARHQFAGTPAYMSPEALEGATPSQMVDLWGLAVTLYEAVTGHNPFSAPTLAETVRLVTRAAVPDPREMRTDCSAEIATFFASALAADHNRRPQSAADFINLLRATELSRTG